jgi:hypothetical protein
MSSIEENNVFMTGMPVHFHQASEACFIRLMKPPSSG